jgi:hypothetical protein
MSSRKIIEAARAVVDDIRRNPLCYTWPEEEIDALEAALDEHAARWAEFHKTPITGGG